MGYIVIAVLLINITAGHGLLLKYYLGLINQFLYGQVFYLDYL